MGRLGRRLARLEASRSKDGRSVSAEALRLLSDEDLEALAETFEVELEDGEGWFEDLYAVVGERGRRAMDAYCEAYEAAKSGTGAREPPDPYYAKLVRRIQEGDEEGAREEWARRDGYRIWKHYKK